MKRSATRIVGQCLSLAGVLLLGVPPLRAFERAAYNPAILSLSFTEQPPNSAQASSASVDPGGTVDRQTIFLDATLILRSGDPIGRRVTLSRREFALLLRRLYQQLARQEGLDEVNPRSASRQLYDALIEPVSPILLAEGVTTLLIAADRGLQAVPFAALHDGRRFFGERYAFALTPAVRFTALGSPQLRSRRLLAAGASQFDGLTPLPLVQQEIQSLVATRPADQFLNRAFTPMVLLDQAADPRYDRVHVASHAEFLPGGPAQAKLHTGTGVMRLSDFLKLRQRRQEEPLELFTLSACRTALGDADTEMGFAGLALQAGSRSAIGTLWYVDDVATSAYFLQLYRFLDAGMPKAEALQATRIVMMKGQLRLEGDRVLGADGTPLLVNLTPVQQRRIAGGLGHPFFWAGIELIGSPW